VPVLGLSPLAALTSCQSGFAGRVSVLDCASPLALLASPDTAHWFQMAVRKDFAIRLFVIF